MKLRTYLVRRTIHMVITVLIVLVLLFVLYRMMPGSAAATMMMNPKMTPADIDRVLVRYGFGKWVDYPGQYTVGNYDELSIGRFTVNVEATDDQTGNTQSLSAHFDVNAPDDVDYSPPRILDAGVSNASIGRNAEFYVLAYDEDGIRSADVTIVCPNLVMVGDNMEPFTETFPLSIDEEMTDEDNRTYYYSGFSTSPLAYVEGDPTFKATFEVADQLRNHATAAIQFDVVGDTFTETSKIWDLSVDIPFNDDTYTYPEVGQSLSLTATVDGGSPTFSIIAPDGESTAITLSGVSGAYSGSFTPSQNGILYFQVEVGELQAQLPFPVNSVESRPFPVPGDTSSYPHITELNIMMLNDKGVEIISPEYPFVLKDLRLSINVTAVNSDGTICSNVTAYIQSPDGSVVTKRLYHPQYVQMRSMAEQFVIYMKTMLVFDFGTSYHYQQSAWSVILDRVPSTMLLFGSALIVSYTLGIMIGVVVAWRRGTVFEMSTILVTLFFYSMPIFWFALIMQWIFYAQLGWFPLAGMGGTGPDGELLEGLSWFIDRLRHLVMPLITLVILGLAGTILLMRSSMLEVIGEDFTTTAKAKGLKERTVVYKHVARNAMLPVVTAMAMSISGIISGGVLTETIFSWYGMGTLLIEGTLQKDFPVVQGAFYIMALLTIFGNMGADILYAWLDPRVQL